MGCTLSGLIKIDRQLIVDELEKNALAKEKYWKHLAAQMVFFYPEKFPILNHFKVNQIEGILKRNSDIEYLKEGEYADIEFGGLILQGSLKKDDVEQMSTFSAPVAIPRSMSMAKSKSNPAAPQGLKLLKRQSSFEEKSKAIINGIQAVDAIWPTKIKYVATEPTIVLCAYNDFTELLRKMKDQMRRKKTVIKENEHRMEEMTKMAGKLSKSVRMHTMRLINKNTHLNTNAGLEKKFSALDTL